MPHYVEINPALPLPSKVVGFCSTEPWNGKKPLPYKDDFTQPQFVKVSDAIWDSRFKCHYWDGTKLIDDPTGHRQKVEALAEAMKSRTPIQKQAANLLQTLSASVVLRCFESGTPFPPEWKAYMAQLRAVDEGTSTTMPTQPAMPSFT
jgi:hypothetical protein